MIADFADDIAAVQHIPEVEGILESMCRITGMGFAAVARVTEDQIEFGLKPGDELKIKTTICDEIRASGKGVFIDHVGADSHWRTHHTPAMYGFESYVSIPIVLADGSFFGTLCAIDPAPREAGLAGIVPQIEAWAAQIADALDQLSAEAST
jgi:GAF domain-containing protein